MADASSAPSADGSLSHLNANERKALQARMDHRACKELQGEMLSEHLRLKGRQKKARLLEIFYTNAEQIGASMTAFLDRFKVFVPVSLTRSCVRVVLCH